MKKIFSILLLSILCIFSSCSNNVDSLVSSSNETSLIEESSIIESSSLEESSIEEPTLLSYGKFDNEDYLYPYCTLKANEENIPIYNCKINFSHTWNASAPQRMSSGVAIVSLKGSITFTIDTTFNIKNRLTIRPSDKNVNYQIDSSDTSVSFTISEIGQYTIEFSNDRTIHLFVNEYGQYDEYKNIENVIYFGPGIHNHSNNSLIQSDNLVHLNSNSVVYIDEGAVVEAGFIAVSKSNITLVGNGIISGACFDRDANTNSKLIPLEFNYCSNLKFYGISNLDPAGWCYNLYFCNDVEIDNIKIISSRSNGDGVSLQSCQNVTCDNSFVRSWDDSLVVKNYPKWSNRNEEGTTKNIKFNNCLIWTDLAQCMEIGYETVGVTMEDITFENITVLHAYHNAVISIHNGNNAAINDVTFKNIIVEDASMGKGSGKNYLIEFAAEFSSTWSSSHKTTALGSISKVIVENVKVYNASNPKISLRGSMDGRAGYNNSLHYVSDITISDLYINNEKIDSNYNNLELVYTKNINFN